MRLVIVGGVAAGMSAATRARRLDEHASIVVFEQGADVSFANCGMPYVIGGRIEERTDLLVVTPEKLRDRFRLDLRVRTRVEAIDRDRQVAHARELDTGRTYEEPYDRLMLATGAKPLRPPVPGLDDPAVRGLRDLDDMDEIHAALRQVGDEGPRVVVIGGGFIGLEMTENLVESGARVALAEMLPHVVPALDAEMAAPLHERLRAHGVDLHLSNAVATAERRPEGLVLTLRDGTELPCDMALLATGVRPNSRLAADAGLELGETGGIHVDAHMRTSDPHVYAAGDAVEVTDYVTGRPALIPLAGPANRQGRVAADNIMGRDSTFRGVQGTCIVSVFGLAAACTGASERTLQRAGIAYQRAYTHPMSHVGYYPGAEGASLKLLFNPDDGRVLGAQVVGTGSVDKRIDVLAMAVHARMTVWDLEEAELAYAPQFGSAKDAANMVGFVASNWLRGDVEFMHADELALALADDPDDPDDGPPFVLDVRTPGEFAAGHIPGATSIPLDQLRGRLDELPRDRTIACYCVVGQRAYLATRALRQLGFRAVNVPGGLLTWQQVQADG